jgi:hypothetical protein
MNPFCIKCRTVLNVYTEFDAANDVTQVEYRHPTPVDHEPEVTFVNPQPEDVLCDFCGRRGVTCAFVLHRSMRTMADDSPVPVTEDYGSPWSSCADCAPVVASKSVRKLTSHVIRNNPELSQLPAEYRPEQWAQLVPFYTAFYAAEPEGPFPLSEV